MRPGIVAVILLLTFGFLGAAVLISRNFQNGRSGGVVSEHLPLRQPEATGRTGKEISDPVPPVVENKSEPAVVQPVIRKTNPAADDSGYVQKRVAELTALAMNNDPNSFASIWSELSNPDKEIRAAALEAVVQFGDRSVVPRLREFAAHVEDPFEKVSILTAAEHLELPSLSELR